MLRLAPAIIILGIGGCWKADPPQNLYLDSGVEEPSVDSTPDGIGGCPSAEGFTVTLENPAASTCQTRQPFRGKAAGADRIVVQGPGGMSAPAKVSTDGSFCVEVLLTAETPNVITFLPIDASGCQGSSLVHSVQHTSAVCGKADNANSNTTSGNVALAGTVLGTDVFKGYKSHLVDGKLDTVVEYSAGWGYTDANVKVQIALGRPIVVERIVVRWRDSKGNGCGFGHEYDLSVSATGSGLLGDSSFTTVESITDGDGGEDVYTFKTKTTVQHVGLLLQKDGCTSWAETFALREVEVWGHDPTTAAPPPDRCL
jgi:hypothetical protein